MFKPYFSEELNQQIDYEQEQEFIDRIANMTVFEFNNFVIDCRTELAIDPSIKNGKAHKLAMKCIALYRGNHAKKQLAAKQEAIEKANRPPTLWEWFGQMIRNNAEWRQVAVFRDEYHKRGLGWWQTPNDND